MYNKKQEKILADLSLSNITSFKNISVKNISKDFLLECIKVNANKVLANFPYTLIDLTEDLSKAMIEKNKYLIEDIPREHIDYKMAESAIDCDPTLISSIPKHILDNSLCLKAIKKEGLVLKDIHNDFKNKELCLEAIKNDAMAVIHTPIDFKDDSFYSEALALNEEIRKYMPKRLYV